MPVLFWGRRVPWWEDCTPLDVPTLMSMWAAQIEGGGLFYIIFKKMTRRWDGVECSKVDLGGVNEGNGD